MIFDGFLKFRIVSKSGYENRLWRRRNKRSKSSNVSRQRKDSKPNYVVFEMEYQ